MRKLAILVFLVFLPCLLFSGCSSQNKETTLRTPHGDVFRITVDPVEPGKPVQHYISALLPDGSVGGKTELVAAKRNVGKEFKVMEGSPGQVLIYVEKGTRRSLFMIWRRNQAQFVNIAEVNFYYRSAAEFNLGLRDPNIFDVP
jgi:hypothetical protein